MQINYLNLTNGLQAIERNELEYYRYLRLQSTACEQKRWDFIIQDLDNDFLMNLALGNDCVVYDYSEKKNCTRALYQGLEWVKYVLSRRWFGADVIPLVRGHNCQKYFDDCYNKLDKKTFRKIDYFKKHIDTKTLNLKYKTGKLCTQ